MSESDEFYEMCKEVDRLIDWAILTHPREGTIPRTQRTRDKLHALVSYWTEKLQPYL